ncbi:hypothetical protein ACSTLO_00745, partial [Vibrio parahaemolyticus]
AARGSFGIPTSMDFPLAHPSPEAGAAAEKSSGTEPVRPDLNHDSEMDGAESRTSVTHRRYGCGGR